MTCTRSPGRLRAMYRSDTLAGHKTGVARPARLFRSEAVNERYIFTAGNVNDLEQCLESNTSIYAVARQFRSL